MNTKLGKELTKPFRKSSLLEIRDWAARCEDMLRSKSVELRQENEPLRIIHPYDRDMQTYRDLKRTLDLIIKELD